jgi:sulfonate transport system ATP-binding protein
MLEIDNISKVYANGVTALRNVTLSVAQGEVVAIVGGSGCGKSTLLRLISGLDRVSSGSIRIEGAAVTSPHPAIGIIFQEPRLLPWLNVAENVAFGLANLTKPERRHRVHEVLKRVGLRDYNARWPRELSGGQSQRVAIARARNAALRAAFG